MPHQEPSRNGQTTETSEYTTSPTPSSNTSYSTDFAENADRWSGRAQQLPSAAAYHRALSELTARSTNNADQRQGKLEARGFLRGGVEMNEGHQPTADNDQLLTAPRVSLSPLDRVSF